MTYLQHDLMLAKYLYNYNLPKNIALILYHLIGKLCINFDLIILIFLFKSVTCYRYFVYFSFIQVFSSFSMRASSSVFIFIIFFNLMDFYPLMFISKIDIIHFRKLMLFPSRTILLSEIIAIPLNL